MDERDEFSEELDIDFKTTKDLPVDKLLIAQVIGQERGVSVIRKAAAKKRNVLLIGPPGTGKSMLGAAMAQLIPKEQLEDILAIPNRKDPNTPKVVVVPAGSGEQIVHYHLQRANKSKGLRNFISIMIPAVIVLLAFMTGQWLMGVFVALVAFLIINQVKIRSEQLVPKLLVDNSRKEYAPFLEATGAHSGAMLGDVRHDPFQSIFPNSKIEISKDGVSHSERIGKVLDDLFEKRKTEIQYEEKRNYEALIFDKKEYQILGGDFKTQTPIFADLLSCNRYEYTGELIRITTEEGKEVLVTPEHKLAVWKDSNIEYVNASDLKEDDEIIAIDPENPNHVLNEVENHVLDEIDIVKTYDKKQQEQYHLYQEYTQLKNQHPDWGYKRIAKAMGQKQGKTRWWHSGKHLPIPVQAVNWLKERGLIPLKATDPRLGQLAKLTGSLFGDGGVFANMNGLFLSSSELSAVQEFQHDLERLFDLEQDSNSRIIESGEKGHSWCYQLTNRNVIRLFLALGAPKGKKTAIELFVPEWIYLKEEFKDQFFGSLSGSELGVPKVHKLGNALNTFDFSITASKNLSGNRYLFLSAIKEFLASKGIKTGEIRHYVNKNRENLIFRFLISSKIDNVLQFSKEIELNYCTYKAKKLIRTLKAFKEIKREKYSKMLDDGYGKDYAMNRLNLTPHSLELILEEEA